MKDLHPGKLTNRCPKNDGPDGKYKTPASKMAENFRFIS